MLQDAYSLRRGQDKVLRRIGVVFNESIPDRSSERLHLPGDPVQRQPEDKQNVLPTPRSSPSLLDEEREQSPERNELAGVATRKVMFPAAAPEELREAAAEAAAAMRASLKIFLQEYLWRPLDLHPHQIS